MHSFVRTMRWKFYYQSAHSPISFTFAFNGRTESSAADSYHSKIQNHRQIESATTASGRERSKRGFAAQRMEWNEMNRNQVKSGAQKIFQCYSPRAPPEVTILLISYRIIEWNFWYQLFLYHTSWHALAAFWIILPIKWCFSIFACVCVCACECVRVRANCSNCFLLLFFVFFLCVYSIVTYMFGRRQNII